MTVIQTTAPKDADGRGETDARARSREEFARRHRHRRQAAKLPAGPAVLVSYGSNSDPNPVTNKAIRLENDRYYFWKDEKLVAVDFSEAAGADNADQWDMMAKSFRWR